MTGRSTPSHAGLSTVVVGGSENGMGPFVCAVAAGCGESLPGMLDHFETDVELLAWLVQPNEFLGGASPLACYRRARDMRHCSVLHHLASVVGS